MLEGVQIGSIPTGLAEQMLEEQGAGQGIVQRVMRFAPRQPFLQLRAQIKAPYQILQFVRREIRPCGM